MSKSESEWIFDYSELRWKYPSVYEKPIRCGFCVLKEWLPIIEDLSSRLQAYLELHPDIDFRVDQVKEKFWGLRFYSSYSDPVIDGYIREAELAVDVLMKKLRSEDA